MRTLIIIIGVMLYLFLVIRFFDEVIHAFEETVKVLVRSFHKMRCIMNEMWKRFVCKVIGHQPRGPIQDQPVLYRCDRCKRRIQFDSERGWLVYNDR